MNNERTDELVSSKLNTLIKKDFRKNLICSANMQSNQIESFLPYNYSSFFYSPYIIKNYFLLKLKILSSVDEYERVSRLRPANEN